MLKSCAVCLFAGLAMAQVVPTPIGPPIAPPDNIATGSTVPRLDDKKFLKEATLNGMAEIELGKLAEEKASSADLKHFAQRMIEEYGAGDRALARIAVDELVVLPKTIDSKRKSRIDRLAKLDGAKFDRAYIEDETRERKQDLKEYTKASQGGNDPDLKNFATSTLPSLEDHLNALKILARSAK